MARLGRYDPGESVVLLRSGARKDAVVASAAYLMAMPSPRVNLGRGPLECDKNVADIAPDFRERSWHIGSN